MTLSVSGAVAPGFEPVADAYARGFESRPAMGAALHVTCEGESVVNLWAGFADARTEKAWSERTASVIFSCTKGLVSIMAARLVQEGRLRYEAPVAQYWPEFAAAGKDKVTVGQALAHHAGLSAPRADLSEDDIVDWNRVVSALAAQEPLWPLGSGYAYHALTHGWVVGEILRRVTGQSVGSYFRERVTEIGRASCRERV